jgi:hypothetical protein
MNKSKENTLHDLSGKVFILLNKLLQEYLLQHPIIFQISLFLHLKNCGTVGKVPPKCITISHNGGKKRIMNRVISVEWGMIYRIKLCRMHCPTYYLLAVQDGFSKIMYCQLLYQEI